MNRENAASHQTKAGAFLKRQDLFLILLFLLVAAAAWFFYRQTGSGSHKQVVVYVGEEEYGRYGLEEEVSVEIPGISGGTNQLEIHHGKADVTKATCPDKICVHQASVSEIGEVIVCMPNQVIVAVEAEE